MASPVRLTLSTALHLALSAALVLTSLGVVALSRGEVDAAPRSRLDCAVGLQRKVAPTVEQVGYEPITPRRIVDTRDGSGGHRGVIPAECTLRIALDDAAPAGSTAVALSVTAVSQSRGFMTVFSCAEGRPRTSNLNTRDDSPTPALVVVAPDAAGEVCIFSKADADVVVDLQGAWGLSDSRFTPVTPVRAYDTRLLPGRPPLPAGGIRNVPLANVVVPADATAVVVNLTVTETSAPGWVLAYPCGVEPPLASNGNYLADESRAIAVIVGLGTARGGEGQLCVQTKEATHFIVDVVGFHSPAPRFGPETSVRTSTKRIVDTRTDEGEWTTPFDAEEIRQIDPLAGHPDRASATSVTLNAIGLNVEASGFLGFYPCLDDSEAARPTVSSLNTAPDREVANLVTVELSARGTICVFSKSAGDVVLDLVSVGTVEPGVPLRRLDLGDAEVWPPFEPAVTDYAMICSGPLTTVDVAAVGHEGRSVTVDGALGDIRRGGTVSLRPDDLLSIGVSAAPDVVGSEPITYRIRCLPADFPELAIERPGAPAPGWYLTALTATSPASSFVMILNERGVPIWYKRTPRGALNPQVLTAGGLVFSTGPGPYGADPERVASVIDMDGRLLDAVTTDDPVQFPLDHHELIELPNGGWMTLSYPLRGGVDLTELNGPPPSDYPPRPPGEVPTPEFGADEFVADNSLREIDAAGELVWEWTASEHFAIGESQFPVRFNQYRTVEDGGEVDLYHFNAVDRVGDGSGDYLITARHLDAVARVDRTTGEVAWILTSAPIDGSDLPPNPDGATRLQIIGDPLGGPRRPHDGRLVGDVLTLFDNRTGTGEPARAVAYRIDQQAGTATLLWQVDDPAGRSSAGLGVTRAAPDGSVLVGWGALQPMFAEYDADGDLLWSIEQVPAGNAFRIAKYPADVFDIDDLRRTAGGAVSDVD